ncbi:MAG: DUF1302 domain-containing protein [Parashewanella sp.]
MKKIQRSFSRSALALGIASAMSLGATINANAASFDLGEVKGTFDSTWTVGATWRVSGRDWKNQIGKVNHPRFGFKTYSAFGNTIYPSSEIWAQEGSYSSNNDLSNLLYAKGDTTSEVVKGLHELSLEYKNFGLFARGMYFYDRKLNNGDFGYRNPITGKKFDACIDKKAKEVQCKDIRLLDAFVYGNFDFNGGQNPLTVRIGNQVVSWGESTLIPHGIGVVNPLDLNVLRQPGAELKEAFRPQGMIWASLGITDQLSVEAFYQYDWQSMWVPAPGSFFATNDFVGFGGHLNNAQLGFNSNPDINLDFVIQEYNKLGQLLKSGKRFSKEQLVKMALAYPTKVTLVDNEVEAPDDGQYGIKLSYYSPELHDTEFGFYFINYHSRRPLISGRTADFSPGALLGDLAVIGREAGNIDRNTLLSLKSFSKAQIVYPEDIKLYGLSFNTLVGDTSVAGEISYRQDEPLQIDDVELLFAAMPQQLANAGLRPDLDGISQYTSAIKKAGLGEAAEGFILSDTTQLQFTLTHSFGRALGFDNLVTLAEVGGVWIHDMPDPDKLRLNGPGTARSGGNPPKAGVIKAIHNGPETNPFPTDFAWGYKLVAKAEFNNLFDGINMAPRVIFSHDVKGITPDPLFLFTEDRKSVAIGLNFDYQSRWGADLSYTNFFGGVGTTNPLSDRDFVSFNIKYSI